MGDLNAKIGADQEADVVEPSINRICATGKLYKHHVSAKKANERQKIYNSLGSSVTGDTHVPETPGLSWTVIQFLDYASAEDISSRGSVGNFAIGHHLNTSGQLTITRAKIFRLHI
ncbi:hypothetical protein HUJ05_006704 [Dendroctonus ponderosae]|nr:hypothetical protein HUJ05_006704 [Dendroctonus ponderosae]